MKKKLCLVFVLCMLNQIQAQIYQETRYQIMINHRFKEKNLISFQPEMRVNDWVKNTTLTLWRLVYQRQINDKVTWGLGGNWFNNWYNYDVTSNEIRFHVESALKDKLGHWTYSNRYRLEYRNFYTGQWDYKKSTFRMRYLLGWSRDIYKSENGLKVTLTLADEIFINVAGTKHFNLYDQNRLGGYLITKLNKSIQIRTTYWWEYRGKKNYNHQVWMQFGVDV